MRHFQHECLASWTAAQLAGTMELKMRQLQHGAQNIRSLSEQIAEMAEEQRRRAAFPTEPKEQRPPIEHEAAPQPKVCFDFRIPGGGGG